VMHERYAVLELLLEAGANPDLLSSEGKTALVKSTRWKPRATPILLRHGADPYDAFQTRTSALNSAIDQCSQKAELYEPYTLCMSQLAWLLRDVDLKGYSRQDRQEAAREAVDHGYAPAVALLLEAFGGVKAEDREQSSLLLASVWEGEIATAKVVLAYGGDPFGTIPGLTYVELARRQNDERMAELLLEWQAKSGPQ